jgi:hypothetical protein
VYLVVAFAAGAAVVQHDELRARQFDEALPVDGIPVAYAVFKQAAGLRGIGAMTERGGRNSCNQCNQWTNRKKSTDYADYTDYGWYGKGEWGMEERLSIGSWAGG